MFRRLRRIIMAGFCGFVGCIAIYAFQYREVLSPALGLAEALKIRINSDPRPTDLLTGQVIGIDRGVSLKVKGDDGKVYRLSLTGVEIPGTMEPAEKIDKRWEESVRSKLRQMAVSNRVEISVTYMSDRRTGLGIVRLGDENINQIVLGQGLGKLKKEYLKGLPLKEQFELIEAERIARWEYRGLWGREIPPVSQFDNLLSAIPVP